MKVVLEFDYYKKVMYIPEGYIQDLKVVVQMNYLNKYIMYAKVTN